MKKINQYQVFASSAFPTLGANGLERSSAALRLTSKKLAGTTRQPMSDWLSPRQ